MKKGKDDKKVQSIEVFSAKDFHDWLVKHHEKESSVAVILHKKHTGKMKTNTAELMKVAISFGWIDTTAKRVDEDRWSINYKKRNKNSKWSYNTLKYGKELIKQGKMHPQGLKFYKEGLKKPPHDYGIPDNPYMPLELRQDIEKNKGLMEKFDKIAPSMKKMYYRWIIRAKRPETKEKRIKEVVKRVSEGKKGFLVMMKDV